MVKNVDDMDKNVRKIYNETSIPDDIFKNAYKILEAPTHSKRKSSFLYIGIAACFTIFIVALGILKLNNKPNNEPIQSETPNTANVNQENDTSSNLRASVDVNVYPTGIHSFASFGEVEYYLAIRLDKILGSTCYIEDRDTCSYPITRVKGTVLKDFKGNYNGDEVEFYIFGGKVPLSEYIGLMGEEEINTSNVKNLTKAEIDNTDANVKLMWVQNQAEAIEGETYIVSLNYDATRYKSLRILPMGEEFNFKFYNIENNTYKNYKDEWKEVDLNNHEFYGIFDYDLNKWVTNTMLEK